MDSNGILNERRVSDDAILWWTWDAQGHNYYYGGRLAMQAGDGNLVLYSAVGVAYWAAWTQGHPGAYLVIQDYGNLIVRSTPDNYFWTNCYVSHWPEC